MTDETKIALDLSISHFRRRYGDVEVFGTWLRTTREPVLVFAPAIRRASRAWRPAVIRLNNTWIYTEELGDPEAAARECFAIADALGADPDMRTCMKLLGIIRSCIDDLLKMPPAPTSTRVVAADILMIDRNTGRETHAEVLDDV